MRRLQTALVAGLLFSLALNGCAESDTVSDPRPPFETLSEYGFFVGPLAELIPAEGVLSYVPASPLWADHAGKARYIVLPTGGQIVPDGDENWKFPLGTVVVKNFFFSLDRREPEGRARVMETRLLIREDVEEGWTAHTYVWNEEQTEAERTIAGGRRTVVSIDENGESVEQIYLIPNTNQCRDCHGRDDITVLLGVNSYQLDFYRDSENQLDAWESLGVFTQAPQREVAALVDPSSSDSPLEARARSYLHANCSHCHRPGGDGGRSGLDLRSWQDDEARFGICKTPVAAGSGAGGRFYDIVPGHPEQSILPFRMGSVDPEVRMPELPSRLPDDFGVTLIEEWIASMPGEGCP